MKRMRESKSGLLIPEEPKPRDEYKDYVQRDLMQKQLPGFISVLEEDGGKLQAVVSQEGGICGRYTVLYNHHTEFHPEIYC